jgi:uncharacterized protein
MLKRDGAVFASASDIVNYLGCAHCTTLDLIDLETPLEKAPDSEEMQLVQEKGRAHEKGFLEGLRGGAGWWRSRRCDARGEGRAHARGDARGRG